jgi:16S rRNA A1518/A1519 N6-dimethyltransferase RsmA/KsgA/DIM1 with predicted DNA glycosylase/AP lyase activity
MGKTGMKNVDFNEKLIIDVGVSEGNDTAFYLKKGFTVVGVEVDPTLIPLIRKRFDTVATSIIRSSLQLSDSFSK